MRSDSGAFTETGAVHVSAPGLRLLPSPASPTCLPGLDAAAFADGARYKTAVPGQFANGDMLRFPGGRLPESADILIKPIQ